MDRILNYLIVAGLILLAVVVGARMTFQSVPHRAVETARVEPKATPAPAPTPAPTPQPTKQVDPENVLVLTLKDGPVEIEMLPLVAPNHVTRIKELVRQKFYDGLKFHRVIEGFMVQTGDPLGNGTGGSGKKLAAEFSSEKHTRGAVSMARSNDPNSADSQFFIVTADSLFLDRNYTVWGRVISGMEFVDKIKRGDANRNGLVIDPDTIVSMRMKADLTAGK